MRGALASGVAAGVFVLSYAAQRLCSAAGGEVPYEQVIATEHIPFFWRCSLAAAHAVLAAVLCRLLPASAVEPVLRRLPAVLAVVVGASALAMVWVP